VILCERFQYFLDMAIRSGVFSIPGDSGEIGDMTESPQSSRDANIPGLSESSDLFEPHMGVPNAAKRERDFMPGWFRSQELPVNGSLARGDSAVIACCPS
jgi:hypothetical protein